MATRAKPIVCFFRGCYWVLGVDTAADYFWRLLSYFTLEDLQRLLRAIEARTVATGQASGSLIDVLSSGSVRSPEAAHDKFQTEESYEIAYMATTAWDNGLLTPEHVRDVLMTLIEFRQARPAKSGVALAGDVLPADGHVE